MLPQKPSFFEVLKIIVYKKEGWAITLSITDNTKDRKFNPLTNLSPRALNF